MKKRKFLLFGLIALLLLALAACNGDETVEDETLDETVEEIEEDVEEQLDEEAADVEEEIEEEDEDAEEVLELDDETTLGTEDNPIIMSFVPSGDTQEILISGDELADMITERTGLVVEANVGTDFAAVREAMGGDAAFWLHVLQRADQRTRRFGHRNPGRSAGRNHVLGRSELDVRLHHPAHHARRQRH